MRQRTLSRLATDQRGQFSKRISATDQRGQFSHSYIFSMASGHDFREVTWKSLHNPKNGSWNMDSTQPVHVHLGELCRMREQRWGMQRPSTQKRHKNPTQHLPPGGGPPQLLRSCSTVGKKGAQSPQRPLDLGCLSMGTRERQRRLPLMARLGTHGREEKRPTCDSGSIAILVE